jgi:fructoselysine-6-P-deglycase FrlB-like protein
VRIGDNTSTTLALHGPKSIIKSMDDTLVVVLIANNNESAYREEMSELVLWYQDNNLSLNVIKTKEFIVDFRKQIHINRTAVESQQF